LSTFGDSPLADGPLAGIDPHAPLPTGNTSATGGYLVPPQLPDNLALRRFFQALIAGVTLLPGPSVRPLWQKNAPPQPEIDVDWCAFGIEDRRVLGNIFVRQNDNDATVKYDQRLTLRCMFYGPNCEGYAERLQEGLPIGQNREAMQMAGMGVASIGRIVHVPELFNDQWYDRCDVSFMIDREVSKLYQILSFGSAIGVIITENMRVPFAVAQP
jgi:hypothetical protein